MTTLLRPRLSAGAEALAARLHARPEPDSGFDCDVLVVGSGYGGAVAAARLAGASVTDDDGQGQRPAVVWVLERGRERRPGSFPSRFADLPGDIRFSLQDGAAPRGVAEGLFDVRVGDDVHVLVGNGLGGGSLINAGVMERPSATTFDSGWPAALAQDAAGREAAFDRAEAMLGHPGLVPDPRPRKLEALQSMAIAQGLASERGFRCHVAVNFDAAPSPAGVEMRACTRCGDCVSGCNQGAKRTLDSNYLAWARRAGAELFCGGVVERLEHDVGAGVWRVLWHFTATGKRPPSGQPFALRARHVVLAAGSLGSTEILLRSRTEAWHLPCLGRAFSTNGNQIAAAFRQNKLVDASRDEDTDPAAAHEVGPAITGLVQHEWEGVPIAVEEFAVPAALRRVMGEVTTTFGLFHAMFNGRARRHPADGDASDPDAQDELAVTRSSLTHTSILGFMGDDGAQGRIGLAGAGGGFAGDGGVTITWNRQDGRLAELFDAQVDWLKSACDGSTATPGPGGTVVPNPTWQLLPSSLQQTLQSSRGTAITVHPLGGCPMGEDVTGGVVDHAGRVFDGLGGTLPGLAVLDGAIVPHALGVNPALTIAALAERAVPLLAAEWGLARKDPRQLPAQPLPPPEVMPSGWQAQCGGTGLRIGEQMHGPVTIEGRAFWAELEVKSMETRDLAAMLPMRRREIRFADGDFAPRLRLYDRRPRVAADRKAPNFVGEALLSGAMQLLESGADLEGDAGDAALIEAVRVLLDRILSRPAGLQMHRADLDDKASAEESVFDLLKTLDNVLATRQLRYELRVEQSGGTGLPAGGELVGRKTLSFGEHANPWKQLTTMVLEMRSTPDQDMPPLRLGELTADLAYFARWRLALLDLTAQRNQPSALADLASLALLLARVLMQIHWPGFVPPGDTAHHIPQRRPQALDGLEFEQRGLNAHGAVLTHYWRADAPNDARGTRPLLMIHGLSASGSTFAHPSIPGNLVRFMAGRKRRDVWVLDLRTSSANEPEPGRPRPGPYRFEDTQDDIRDAVAEILKRTGAQQVDIVAHCIGAAMFCRTVLADDELHRRVGRVVLSQVGPMPQLSPYNRLRGLIASFLQQYLQIDELDTRPDHVRVGADQWQVDRGRSHKTVLLDALLSSFPYPDDEMEAARARRLDVLPGVARDFRLVRHRADGLIGHSLHLPNVGDETLLALDAIYGWVKTSTLAQTLYIGREGVLTDGDGLNRVVSGETLGRRFGFPVLLLHGARNQVFDVDGSEGSYRTLRRSFQDTDESGGRDDGGIGDDGNLHLGRGTSRQLLVLRRYGHQDCMIGEAAQHEVFPAIERFLAQELPARRPPPRKPPSYLCIEPWMGPMLGWVRAARGAPGDLELSVLLHAGPRRADLLCVVVAPASRQGDRWTIDPGQARGYTLEPTETCHTQRELLLEQALTLRLAAPAAGETAACGLLLLYRQFDDPGTGPEHIGRPVRGTSPGVGFELSGRAKGAVRAFLRSRGNHADLLLMVPPGVRSACDQSTLPAPAVRPLAFVLGSCQYPQGLFDKQVAGDTWRRILADLVACDGAGALPPGADPDDLLATLEDRAEGDAYGRVPAEWKAGGPSSRPPAPGFALLLGDQVYLDATSNVFEAPGNDPAQRSRRGYELNWRLRARRRVGARLPIYAMLDDHEIDDNWQPGDGPPAPESRAGRALQAYRCHQHKLNPVGSTSGGRAGFTYRFTPAGVPFFVLDTRTRRQWRSVGGGPGTQPIDDARIVPSAVMIELFDWLCRHRAAPVKFIASPSVVLPMERHAGTESERLAYDSWSGYPASLHALLRFIDDERIGGVVFLSGDAHLSMAVALTFDSGHRVHAVVASGLYAPWPFTNAKPEAFVLDGPVRLTHAGHELGGEMTPLLLMADAGYAWLAVDTPSLGTTSVRVEFRPHDGSAPVHCQFTP